MRKLALAVLLLTAVGFSTTAKDRYIKTGYIGDSMASVSCKNGVHPIVVGNYGSVLIVSCGK